MGKAYNTKSNGNIFKNLRQKIKLSQQDVATKLSIVPSTISKWETGVTIPDQSMLPKIASLYGVTTDYLLGLSDLPVFDMFNIENIIPLPETELVPLLGTIACGSPILADENVEDYLTADRKHKATFALRCKGDSMIMARIFDGDIVFIHQQEQVENGQIAAVLIENEATLKRVYSYPNRIELRAENPTFPPINIEGESLNDVKIIGRAVAFTSVVR